MVNEKEERKKLFDYRLKLMDKYGKKLRYVETGTGKLYNIPNSSISFNNKIVEILHIFDRNNKSAMDSELFSMIYNHLLLTFFKAEEVMNSFVSFIRKMSEDEELKYDYDYIIENNKNYVGKLKELDDILFKFDIEKNILDAYNTLLNRTKEIEDDGGFTEFSLNKSTYIDIYNNELNELGYNIKIPKEENKKHNL